MKKNVISMVGGHNCGHVFSVQGNAQDGDL